MCICGGHLCTKYEVSMSNPVPEEVHTDNNANADTNANNAGR